MATFGARKIASVASLTDHDRVYQFNRFSKISFISGADLLNTMYSDILGNSLGNDAVFVPSNVNMPAFSIISYLCKASNTDARTVLLGSATWLLIRWISLLYPEAVVISI